MRAPLFRPLIGLVLMLAVSAAFAEDEVDVRGLTPATWDQLWTQAMARSGGRAQQEGQVWVIDVPQDRAVYFFTTPLHAAHPSVVRRARVEGDKGAFIKTIAWTDGSPTPFKDWLKALLKPKQN